MTFTLADAAALWTKLKENSLTTTTLPELKNEMAIALEEYKSNDLLEQTLRNIFERAGVTYPETIHVLHIKTTLVTALRQIEGEN